MRRFILFALLLSLLLPAGMQAQAPQGGRERPDMRLRALRTEFENELTGNILPFWIEYAVDPSGGFYGAVEADGTPVRREPKGSVLNARILWSFSVAYRRYGLGGYKKVADRAADYILRHFIDPRYGGVYWSVDADGAMLDGSKHTDAQTYTIYALAEHYAATGNAESLEAAKTLFHDLQAHVHDAEKGGWTDLFARDWSLPAENRGAGRRTANTYIHIVEACTSLYRVWPDAEVRAALEELVDTFNNRFYDPETRHYVNYCDADWKPVAASQGFGLDIEASWLAGEGAKALGDAARLARANEVSLAVLGSALAEGLTADGAMKTSHSARGFSSGYEWWPQCEAIIGCTNAWQLTGEEKYLDAARGLWEYVKAHFVDPAAGGWFKTVRDDGTPTGAPKISQWNCPYHNTRLCYEMITRLTR